MSSQRATELPLRTQSGGSGPASPVTGRSGNTSSKAPSTVDSIDFRFLNFTHPKDAKNAQTRRNVRSHVTSKQHEKQRKVAAEQARRAHESPGPSETELSSPDDVSPPAPTAASSRSVRINPIDVYPEEWHPYLRPVIDHYLSTMSIDLPETDSVSRQLLQTTYMAIVLADKAALHALLLAAGAHFNKVRAQSPHRIDLLQLRGMAIQEINSALVDHGPGGRATSDQLIAAVGKMATYELLFGQRDTFHTHMTGLQRMVSLRGGLQALDTSGLLERILLWIDANAAELTGGALYFPPAAFSSSSGHPRANRRLFVLGFQASPQASSQ